NHPGKTASRISSTTEAEDEDLVAGYILRRDCRIAVLDLLEQTGAHCASQELHNRNAICTDAGVVDRMLHTIDHFKRFKKPAHIRMAIGIVPGAIRTKDDVLRHRKLL